MDLDPPPSSITLIIYPFLLTAFSGVILSALYLISQALYQKIKNLLFATIDIESMDPLYSWLLDYLTELGHLKGSVNKLSCKILRKENSPYFWISSNDLNTDKERPSLIFQPNNGLHSFRYEGIRIYINSKFRKNLKSGYDRKLLPLETLSIFCYDPKNISVLKSICQAAIDHNQNKSKNLTNIYCLHEWADRWVKVQSKFPRQLDSVILDASIAEDLIIDIRKFISNKLWYQYKGIPFRRGFLLYGPPGTGKTSFVIALAGKLGFSICPLNLSGNDMDDDRLSRVLEKTPENAIVLVEDVDAIFAERTSIQEREGQKVTFSGLLNALDGIKSQEGRIVFMSTNHIEKLDPALLRPGRIDVKIKLDYASSEQIKRIFLKFFPERSPSEATSFSLLIPEGKLSMAKLQGYFLRYKNDFLSIMSKTSQLLDQSESTTEMSIRSWLFHFGLDHLSNGFHQARIRRVSDLKGIGPGELVEIGVKRLGDRNVLLRMIKGDEEIKKSFRFMHKSGIQAFFDSFTIGEDSEKLANMLPEGKITEFHLRKLLHHDVHLTMEERVRKLMAKVKSYEEGRSGEDEEEEKKRKKLNPKVLMENIGLKAYLKKFEENDSLEEEVFYELDKEKLQAIGVDKLGDRMIIEREIKKEKEREEEREGRFGIETAPIFSKSCTIYY